MSVRVISRITPLTSIKSRVLSILSIDSQLKLVYNLKSAVNSTISVNSRQEPKGL